MKLFMDNRSIVYSKGIINYAYDFLSAYRFEMSTGQTLMTVGEVMGRLSLIKYPDNEKIITDISMKNPVYIGR